MSVRSAWAPGATNAAYPFARNTEDPVGKGKGEELASGQVSLAYCYTLVANARRSGKGGKGENGNHAAGGTCDSLIDQACL